MLIVEAAFWRRRRAGVSAVIGLSVHRGDGSLRIIFAYLRSPSRRFSKDWSSAVGEPVDPSPAPSTTT